MRRRSRPSQPTNASPGSALRCYPYNSLTHIRYRICIYIYKDMYVCIYLSIYIYIYQSMYISIYPYMYIYIKKNTCIYMHVCVYISSPTHVGRGGSKPSGPTSASPGSASGYYPRPHVGASRRSILEGRCPSRIFQKVPSERAGRDTDAVPLSQRARVLDLPRGTTHISVSRDYPHICLEGLPTHIPTTHITVWRYYPRSMAKRNEILWANERESWICLEVRSPTH